MRPFDVARYFGLACYDTDGGGRLCRVDPKGDFGIGFDGTLVCDISKKLSPYVFGEFREQVGREYGLGEFTSLEISYDPGDIYSVLRMGSQEEVDRWWSNHGMRECRR